MKTSLVILKTLVVIIVFTVMMDHSFNQSLVKIERSLMDHPHHQLQRTKKRK